jgi:hypothetical protein
MFLGAVFVSVAAGLYTTFTPSTPHARWISYQVIQGLGTGTAIQMPLLSVQAVLASKPHQIPIGMSLVAFCQYFGGSVGQSIALAVFQNQLIKSLTYDAGLNDSQVNTLLLAGNARVRQTTRAEFPGKMADVLNGYNKAITTVFVSSSPPPHAHFISPFRQTSNHPGYSFLTFSFPSVVEF